MDSSHISYISGVCQIAYHSMVLLTTRWALKPFFIKDQLLDSSTSIKVDKSLFDSIMKSRCMKKTIKLWHNRSTCTITEDVGRVVKKKIQQLIILYPTYYYFDVNNIRKPIDVLHKTHLECMILSLPWMHFHRLKILKMCFFLSSVFITSLKNQWEEVSEIIPFGRCPIKTLLGKLY